MEIKVLGPGCANCERLERYVHAAVDEMGVSANIAKVNKWDYILAYDVMTTPGSNSGIYVHTKFQETGWPAHGYESQVNVSHRDKVKTGSLYGVVKLFKTPA